MTFLELVDKNIRKEEVRLKEFKRELSELADGELVRRSRNGVGEYYVSSNGAERYIRKKEYWRVNELKRRKVLERACKISESNIDAQRKLLNTYNEIDFDRIQKELPARYQGIDFAVPNFKPGEMTTDLDGDQFFVQSENLYKPEELVNSTFYGLKTRSKSEAMIAETLYRNKFSLYYEKRLFLVDAYGNPRTVYPDFTIPVGRNYVVYWEHKGLLDSDEYILRDAEKTRLYHINDIYQPKNLIVTAEKHGGGIDNEYVEYLVNGFLEQIRKNLVYI